MSNQPLPYVLISLLLQEVKECEVEVNKRVAEITPLAQRWIEAATAIVPSWSGSYYGYHSELYFGDFERPPLSALFSPEWGGIYGVPQGWRVRPAGEVRERMQHVAGGVDIGEIEKKAEGVLRMAQDLRDKLLLELTPLQGASGFQSGKELLVRLEQFSWGMSRGEYAHANMPTEYRSRDSDAVSQGVRLPAHLFYEAVAAESRARCSAAQEFLKLAQRLLRALDTSTVVSSGPGPTKIFIGHGRSLLWLKLKIFLTEKLHLECDEFNEESAAGIPTTTRLQSMLDQAKFAFLVMTSEDAHADGTGHARENVVHEAGLFQGRLGFGRAIILLEEGCAEFSNIHGLGQIRFPKGNIDAKFEDVREVLNRERIIS